MERAGREESRRRRVVAGAVNGLLTPEEQGRLLALLADRFPAGAPFSAFRFLEAAGEVVDLGEHRAHVFTQLNKRLLMPLEDLGPDPLTPNEPAGEPALGPAAAAAAAPLPTAAEPAADEPTAHRVGRQHFHRGRPVG